MVGTGIVLLPDDATAVLLTVATPADVDVATVARAMAELIGSRLAAYMQP
jgi:hypothetical protein